MPTEPVFMAAGAPAVLDEPPGAAALVASPLIEVVGEGCPEVKGASETGVAPGKAPSPSSSEGLAMVALEGLRTSSIT